MKLTNQQAVNLATAIRGIPYVGPEATMALALNGVKLEEIDKAVTATRQKMVAEIFPAEKPPFEGDFRLASLATLQSAFMEQSVNLELNTVTMKDLAPAKLAPSILAACRFVISDFPG